MATNGADQIDPITQQQIQIGQLMIQNGQLIIDRAQMMQKITELTAALPDKELSMPSDEPKAGSVRAIVEGAVAAQEAKAKAD